MNEAIDFDHIPPLRQLEAVAVDQEGEKMIALTDPTRTIEGVMTLTPGAFFILSLLDKEKSLDTLLDEVSEKFEFTPNKEEVMALITQAEEAAMLDNLRFARMKKKARDEFLNSPVRKAAFAGKSYPKEPKLLAKELARLLEGNPVTNGKGEMKAIIAPHIDFSIGADLMAAGWREIKNSDVELVIILGTGHALVDDFFSCVDKDYETPIGTVKTDSLFLKVLGEKFGEDIFENAEAHKNEHSVEFAALFMASLFSGRPDVMAVPILLSFPEIVWDIDGGKFAGVRVERFIKALREAVKTYGKKTIFVASVDFAHVGARFGDSHPLSKDILSHIENCDQKLLESIGNMDRTAFLETIKKVNPLNRICGFPALYTLLNVCDATKGIELGYRQNVEGDKESMVSFAAMALY